MTDLKSFDVAVERYLEAVRTKGDRETVLVYSARTLQYKIVTSYQATTFTGTCEVKMKRVVMWLTPNEAEEMLKRRQQTLEM